MINWQTIPDDILLQAHINHMKKICGKEMSNNLNQARISRVRAFYERNPELIVNLEQEITKLIG